MTDNETSVPRSGRAIGRSLRIWRQLHRVKQSHAAEMIGVSQATISRIENGDHVPTGRELGVIRNLVAARLSDAGDRALAQLVRHSAMAVHLVCDDSHRLLALSPGRQRQARGDARNLIGRSLWPCASPEIVRLESELEDLGWFEPAPEAIVRRTSAHHGPFLDIVESRFRATRIRLSDGSYARLVETLI
ncbi:MAG: helix-turn-helix transcriptional regulator [Rhodospirillales bacterium]